MKPDIITSTTTGRDYKMKKATYEQLVIAAVGAVKFNGLSPALAAKYYKVEQSDVTDYING
jgi:hypothetical protein